MPPAVAALTAQAWPGNLRELKAVLAHAIGRRSGDAISVEDLPDGYRSEVPDRPIPVLDLAERDVIVAPCASTTATRCRSPDPSVSRARRSTPG